VVVIAHGDARARPNIVIGVEIEVTRRAGIVMPLQMPPRLAMAVPQSCDVYHFPRSSTTTLSPATASSLATIPPAAPAPMTTAFTRFMASNPLSARAASVRTA